MKFLVALAIAISVALGNASVSQAPQPTEVSQAVTVSQEQSEENILRMDATVTWDDYLDVPITGEEISYTWVAYSYEKPENLLVTEFALPSIDLGVWHVYRAQWLTKA